MKVMKAKLSPLVSFTLLIILILTVFLIFKENTVCRQIQISHLNFIDMHIDPTVKLSIETDDGKHASTGINSYEENRTRNTGNKAKNQNVNYSLKMLNRKSQLRRKLKSFNTSRRALTQSEISTPTRVKETESTKEDGHESELHSKAKCVQRLPACIIIGVQKCGTKALAEFLKIHPNISVDSRQTYYFSQNYEKGLDWYKEQMPCSQTHEITLERTPQYFYFKDAPRRIYDMDKTVKFILIVCDPVKRAISNFAMAQDLGRAENGETFEECVLMSDDKTNQINTSCKYIKKSNYQRFMMEWLQFFPLQQIHIANGANLIKDPVAELIKIEKFLGIPRFIKEENFVVNVETGFKCIRNIAADRMECLSRKKGRHHPVIRSDALLSLKQYFKLLNFRFFEMIGQTFEWNTYL